ncbi:MAG: PAS domain S-box protein [Oscillospiraceae bacterium]|nr:PAS domain S-box protein [Oscillospiraceae bacterium]
MPGSKNKHKIVSGKLFVACIVFAIAIGAIYSCYSLKFYTDRAKTEAIGLAAAVSSFINPYQIETFNANSADIDLEAYQSIKRGLMIFKAQKTGIEYAYILESKDNKLYFLVDSEVPDSNGYSGPGQEYYEASALDLLPFSTGEAVLTEPQTDRWGTWVSALVPIIEPRTGRIVAVFGVDYPAEYWKAETYHQVLPKVASVTGMILLLSVLFSAFMSSTKARTLSKKLSESEALFKAVFEQSPVGVSLVGTNECRSKINAEFARILARTKDEINSVTWREITHPEDLERDLEQFAVFSNRKIPGYSMEKRYIRPDGSYIWVNMEVARIQIDGEAQENWSHVCIIQDINDKKIAEETLHESERSRSMLLANLPGMAYRCKFDENWTMMFISEGCCELTGYKPESLINNRELSYNEIIVPEMREFLWTKWEHQLALKMPFRCEYEIMTADGTRKWVLETGQGVYNSDGSIDALEGIIIDITESKQRQVQIQYINDHDALTNLFNRGYYERAKAQLDQESNLPLSIIVVDINGLRLINDAFGNAIGDSLISETAKIIQSCCGDSDILARTGGDEFSIISPNTDCERANGLLLDIKKACLEHNSTLTDKALEINLSLGQGFRQTNETSIDDIEKEAEICIDRRKLLDKKSHHNTVLSSIMATMFARSYETESHALSLGQYSKLIGEKMNLPQSCMDELELFSLLHDIGKIGIDDRILNKPGELTSEEWEIMKRHPEIGFVITMSSPDFAAVAECVLAHHERWDGMGYPLGLSGEEIPLLARILAVADAYDAMTSDRVYRKALSKQTALEEIRKNVGTQFDPEIAKLFIEILEL